MGFIKDHWKGIALCLGIALIAWQAGKLVPVAGGPILGILLGIVLGLLFKDKRALAKGTGFVSKKLLQAAVVLLGFGLNFSVVLKTGWRSLPIILGTITIALVTAFVLQRALKVPEKTATLIGVGSSICGASAIAATAPVVDADDEAVAQAMSVIFLFNVIAALIFPALGTALGFSQANGEAFGLFAGTAVNDTSSVTAAASTWDTLYGLGTQTLDHAVTVKLTRTLAIIPITLGLSAWRARTTENAGQKRNPLKAFPIFMAFFMLASLVTTLASNLGVSGAVFAPLKDLSKFLIIMAMSAIGLNTDLGKLVRSGAKPILLGFSCWTMITLTSLLLQKLLGIW